MRLTFAHRIRSRMHFARLFSAAAFSPWPPLSIDCPRGTRSVSAFALWQYFNTAPLKTQAQRSPLRAILCGFFLLVLFKRAHTKTGYALFYSAYPVYFSCDLKIRAARRWSLPFQAHASGAVHRSWRAGQAGSWWKRRGSKRRWSKRCTSKRRLHGTTGGSSVPG